MYDIKYVRPRPRGGKGYLSVLLEKGVLEKSVVPYDDLPYEQKAWVYLFSKGLHNVKTKSTNLDDWKDELKGFVQKEEKKEEEEDEDEGDDEGDEEVSTPLSMTSLLDVHKFVNYLIEDGFDVQELRDSMAVFTDKARLCGYGEAFVRASEAQRAVQEATIKALSNELTPQKKRALLEKKKKEKQAFVDEHFGSNVKIGDLLDYWKSSISSVLDGHSITNPEEIFGVISSDSSLEKLREIGLALKNMLASNDNSSLHTASRIGLTMKYYKSKNTTWEEMEDAFGYSKTTLQNFIKVYDICFEYPVLLKTGAPYTVVAKNANKMRKFLNSSLTERFFWQGTFCFVILYVE
jgi:hypothetical protein